MQNQGYLSFNGSDEYINIDNLAENISSSTFTFSCWIRVNTTSTTGQIFRVIVGTDTDNHMTVMYHASGNEIRANSKLGGVADVLNQGANSIENDGYWHHVVFVVDKTDNDNSILYIDGTAKETIAGVGTLSGTFSKASIANNTAGGGFFNGDIDEVAIWNRVITSTEVTTIYRAGHADEKQMTGIDLVGQMGTSLIGYYRFEEKSGTVAINDIGSNGTLENTPTYKLY
jgi:hypothetical protein